MLRSVAKLVAGVAEDVESLRCCLGVCASADRHEEQADGGMLARTGSRAEALGRQQTLTDVVRCVVGDVVSHGLSTDVGELVKSGLGHGDEPLGLRDIYGARGQPCPFNEGGDCFLLQRRERRW